MKISPKDFFAIIQANVASHNFRILVNGAWHRVIVLKVDYTRPISSYDEIIHVTGNIEHEKELVHVSPGNTVARLGEHDIACSILGCHSEWESVGYDMATGESYYVPCRFNTTISICFRYSLYTAMNGDFRDTIDSIPAELSHMLEIEDDPKKKTFFDWVDLD